MKRIFSLIGLLLCLGAPTARAGEVVIIKSAGVAAFETIAEEFAEHCRIRARLINLDDKTDIAALRQSLKPDDVVLTIGQGALAAVIGTPARIVSTLASFEQPPGVLVADAFPSPGALLRALKQLRPRVRRVGVVFSSATAPLVARAQAEVGNLFELVEISAHDGPEAVRGLHRAVPSIDAIWLTPDVRVLTSQLFQYALSIQIQYGFPLIAATRQQVLLGALMAYAAEPHAVAIRATELVYRLLASASGSWPPLAESVGRLTVNGDVARRLGLEPASLGRLHARVE